LSLYTRNHFRIDIMVITAENITNNQIYPPKERAIKPKAEASALDTLNQHEQQPA